MQGDSNGHKASVPKASANGTQKSGLLLWNEEQLRFAITAAGVALWSWNVDTNQFRMNQRAFDLWCVPLSDYISFDELSSHIHPADRDRVRAAFAAEQSSGLTK
jgi:PAS domain-containing protein